MPLSIRDSTADNTEAIHRDIRRVQQHIVDIAIQLCDIHFLHVALLNKRAAYLDSVTFELLRGIVSPRIFVTLWHLNLIILIGTGSQCPYTSVTAIIERCEVYSNGWCATIRIAILEV